MNIRQIIKEKVTEYIKNPHNGAELADWIADVLKPLNGL